MRTLENPTLFETALLTTFFGALLVARPDWALGIAALVALLLATREVFARRTASHARRLRERVAVLLREGEDLESLLLDEQGVPLEVAAKRLDGWADSVRAFLLRGFGTSAEVQFDNDDGLPPLTVPDFAEDQRAEMYRWLRKRRTRLSEINARICI